MSNMGRREYDSSADIAAEMRQERAIDEAFAKGVASCATGPWISVSERLPEPPPPGADDGEGWVLVRTTSGIQCGLFICWFDSKAPYWYGESCFAPEDVTHWCEVKAP